MFRFTNLIIFELTRDCNLRCEYCLMKEKDLHKGEKIDFELYKKIIDRIIEQRIVNHIAHVPLSFNFHGGELTLVGQSQFYRYLEYAYTAFASQGVRVSFGMQTNGTLLTDEFLKTIKKFGCSIGVSFDGPKANFHRMSNEGTTKLMATLDKIQKLKLSYGTIPVATKKNIRFIKSTLQYLASKNIVGYKINPVGDFVTKDRSLELSGRDIYYKIMRPELVRYMLNGHAPREGYTREAAEAALVDLITVHTDLRRSGCGGKICGAGVGMMAVRPDGQMGYCDRYTNDFEENVIEHALDFDFLGLHQLNKTVRLAQIKHSILKNTGCDDCEARYACFNGCLAFYYSQHGTYGIEKKTTCFQHQTLYSFIKRHLMQILRAYARTEEKIPVYDTLYEYKTPIVRELRKSGLMLKYTRSEEGSRIQEYLQVVPYIERKENNL